MIGLFRPRPLFQRLADLATNGAGLLDPSARAEIREFLLSQQEPDGGFRVGEFCRASGHDNAHDDVVPTCAAPQNQLSFLFNNIIL